MLRHNHFIISGDGEKWYKEQEWIDGVLTFRVCGGGNISPENGSIIISFPKRSIHEVSYVGTCCDCQGDWILNKEQTQDAVILLAYKHSFKGIHQVVRIRYKSDFEISEEKRVTGQRIMEAGALRERHLNTIIDLRRQVEVARETLNLVLVNVRVREQIERRIVDCTTLIQNLENHVRENNYLNNQF